MKYFPQTRPTLHQTPCLLSPTLAAKITHETLGHLAEADGVIAAGVAAPILRLPKLPATITVVDYAHTAFGKPVPMPVYTVSNSIKDKFCGNLRMRSEMKRFATGKLAFMSNSKIYFLKRKQNNRKLPLALLRRSQPLFNFQQALVVVHKCTLNCTLFLY